MSKLKKKEAFSGKITLRRGMFTINCITFIIPHNNCKDVALKIIEELKVYITS